MDKEDRIYKNHLLQGFSPQILVKQNENIRDVFNFTPLIAIK